MSELKFTEDHKWLRLEEDGYITIGITDYAQDQLGDIVYVELPEAGTRIEADKDAAVVESVKSAGEINVPINGRIVEVNELLNDEPEIINSDPMGKGWFIRVSADENDVLDQLMDEAAYKSYIATL